MEQLPKQFRDLLKDSPFRAMFEPKSTGGAESPPASGNPQSDGSQEELKRIQAFNLKPREIRDYLDRYVIQQAEAKKVLSVAICDHYNHVRQCLEDSAVR